MAPSNLTLKSHHFRIERESEWKALEIILKKIETGSLRSLSDDDITSLPRLYRAVLSSLSVARATSLDQNVITYLESLSSRAYYILYGSQSDFFKRARSFFTSDWPAAAQALRLETIISVCAIILGAIIGFLLVTQNPDWYHSFVPEDLAGDRTPASSAESLKATLYDSTTTDNLAVFATSLFSHNSRVAIFAFALGFAFGLPTLILMIYNGLIMGAFLALFTSRDLAFEISGWLIIHGATEVFAITLAGAAGIHLGRAMAFPGALSRRDAAAEAGRQAGTLMTGVVLMLFIAGLLEGFGRQLISHDFLRYAIGLSTLLLWCLYFYAPRMNRPVL